jgi:hypothetical protein
MMNSSLFVFIQCTKSTVTLKLDAKLGYLQFLYDKIIL